MRKRYWSECIFIVHVHALHQPLLHIGNVHVYFRIISICAIIRDILGMNHVFKWQFSCITHIIITHIRVCDAVTLKNPIIDTENLCAQLVWQNNCRFLKDSVFLEQPLFYNHILVVCKFLLSVNFISKSNPRTVVSFLYSLSHFHIQSVKLVFSDLI